jgi:DNA invertase Pin-like site-specific DNA recombinase
MKYFLYARKSTDEDDKQLLSIEAQLEELHEYAARERLEVVREFVEKRTAKEPGRPIFNDMLRRVEKGEADALLAWHPDRLARNSVDGGKIIYLVDTGKLAALKFPSFWFEDTPQGKFMLSIAFGQSKYYVDNLSENVKRGIRQKLRLGWYPGRAPIGYLNEPRLRTIVIDEATAPLVKKLFETYASGETSYRTIADMANRMGLLTCRDNHFRQGWMRGLLSNPFYIGMFRLKGELYEGAHEPLISREMFDRVQRMLNQRSRSQQSPRKGDPCFFTGMIKCGSCGSGVTAQRQKGHHYYNCTRHFGPCDQKKYIREESLALEIHAALSYRTLPGEVADWILAQVDQWQAEEAHRSEGLATQHAARVDDIQARLNRLLDVYLEGTVDKEEYTARKEAFIREKASLSADLAQIKTNGAGWIEPLRAFVTDCKEMGSDLADADAEDLARFAKKSVLNLNIVKPIRGRKDGKPVAIGDRTPADLTCARLPPGGPEPEGRGGGLAARPAKVRTRKDQYPQAFSEGATFDPSADPAHSSASFGAEKCPSAFVFQVSEREPALRVEYPAPLNAVAAFSALSPAEKLNRTGWWGLAVLFRTFFDPDYAKRLQK